HKCITNIFHYCSLFMIIQAAIMKYVCNAFMLIEYRKFQEAIVEVNEGIDFISKTDSAIFLFWMYSHKALLQIMTGDVKGAESTLESACEMRSEIQTAPMQVRDFLSGNFRVMLFRLEESLKAGASSEIATYKTNALKAGKEAVKNSQKVVFERVEVYRCMGIYHWLVNRQKKALHWWGRSIAEGERLGARVELSRTYFEVGKRLLESKSKHKTLNNIKAEEYLDKAREMFEDLDLQWDLDELERVAVNFGADHHISHCSK
ncbi:MAG: hypothetical protein SVY10_16230, partial [Thermodesulfobacteriota bacterium]|nr:hypothetical protein [Thermodesulfobacteriota bacterium]